MREVPLLILCLKNLILLTLNPKILSSKPQTLNPKPYTRYVLHYLMREVPDLMLQTLNPKPYTRYVLHYLMREVPDLMLHLQRGKFDSPDRTFWGVGACWRSVTSNPADVKELIPE